MESILKKFESIWSFYIFLAIMVFPILATAFYVLVTPYSILSPLSPAGRGGLKKEIYG